jgi:redox-sensing transcriptional repressor
MKYRKIPDEAIRRLPVYLRGIHFLSAQGQDSVCSSSLADFVGVNACQIRKDLSYFGELGKPGVGYDLNKLERQITKVLNLESGHNIALVGVGNLGSAVLAFGGFGQYGFNITAAFDSDPKKIGKRKGRLLIEDAANISTIKNRNVDLGIIAVPAEAAQEVADALVAAGVKGILNFAPAKINVPRKVKLITIDIAVELARLPFYITTTRGREVAPATDSGKT